ncbi:flagellar assembly peptidoglycan hydrolase FlgJ [Pseudomonas sp. MAP12]|uniref:Peptidoglycan hydrolase FlgJ n=1 Tax=Geopseudomonas aromaticivorans TaxID=2849492 RepID=A0ABS6MTY1_9GAMM|nr:flagellar assembly peptidoglycan hydrolase FlgJ [Pseudomonas aromaticivorans]MBV2132254.1 flagellar assembly peptidoglycan hydrolase FlgJ [Pseudomonas aromaticivorans]
MSVADLGSQFALDLQGVQRLKQTARQDPAAGLRGASKQFEALFLQMMLKSMREASPQSGLLDSQQSRFYTEMLDQQWSQQLAGHGLGLAEQLTQQLQSQAGVAAAAVPAAEGALIAGIPRGTPRPLYGALQLDPAAGGMPVVESTGSRRSNPLGAGSASAAVVSAVPDGPALVLSASGDMDGGRASHVASFAARLQEPARAASRSSGVPAELILAQAALETGWGRHEIATANGANSHNLFGIKAGSEWQGPTTEVRTTEYVDGQAQSRVERFRVYDSFEAAFTDYARLIVSNPRYAGVVSAPDAQQAARALQRGGYATDPAYADKLIAVMTTLAPFDPSRQVAQL